MRFLSIYKTAETGVPPTREYMETMQRLVEEGMKAGWLLATEGCLPSALGARIRSSGGNLIVTDGPFAETKELIAGFALLEAKSKAEAIQLASLCGLGQAAPLSMLSGLAEFPAEFGVS